MSPSGDGFEGRPEGTLAANDVMSPPDTQRGPRAKVSFRDRLLAESVRALEHDGARPIAAPDAEAKAAAGAGDFESRLVARARAIAAADRLEPALRNTGQVFGAIVAIGVLLAAVAGLSAARASLGSDNNEVNVFWALGGLLAVQTILLLAWVVVMIKTPTSLRSLSLGGAAFGVARRIAGRWNRSAENAAVIEATGAVFARGAIGRWTLSSISHALWLVFNASCVLFVVLILSTGLYRFVWETTILPADAFTSLTRVTAWLPSQLGFPTPTPDQIAASDGSIGPDLSEATRHAWSGLLIGSVVTYGLAPRFVLLVLCVWRQTRARRAYRLDTSRPGYLRLRSCLMPGAKSLGVIDPDTDGEDRLDPVVPTPVAPNRTHNGAPVVLGIEIEPPATPWPPSVAGVAWRDLGFVDDRSDRRRVLGELGNGSDGPSITVAVCGLTTTPDRGIAAFLSDVRQAAGVRMAMVLTGGEALRKRTDGEQLATRVDDWRALADAIGVAAGDVIELDLDHLTAASAAKLASLLGVQETAAVVHRRIEDAFDAIVDHVGGWPPQPETKQQAALHEAIGKLYRPEMSSWTQRFRLPDAAGLKADLSETLRAGAQGIVGILPRRLKADTRWVAAGAIAGALGCVTAAALLSPVAIAGLPMWSVLGAAITAVVRATVSSGAAGAVENATDGSKRGDAVRGAALFALLLELQGRAEAAITRILDNVIGDAADAQLETPEGVQRSLDAMRHRLDIALAGEAAS